MNKPDFLKIGNLVRIQHWVGEVVDVGITDAGKIMVQVKSPKGAWRNHAAEWLEYIEGQILPATEEDARRNLIVYRGYITKILAELGAMGERWGVPLDAPEQFQIVIGDDGPRIV